MRVAVMKLQDLRVHVMDVDTGANSSLEIMLVLALRLQYFIISLNLIQFYVILPWRDIPSLLSLVVLAAWSEINLMNDTGILCHV